MALHGKVLQAKSHASTGSARESSIAHAGGAETGGGSKVDCSTACRVATVAVTAKAVGSATEVSLSCEPLVVEVLSGSAGGAGTRHDEEAPIAWVTSGAKVMSDEHRRSAGVEWSRVVSAPVSVTVALAASATESLLTPKRS